jgi:MFS family permease
VVQTRQPLASPEPEPEPAPAAPLDNERSDVRSLAFALAGTFVLRCGSYGAGSIIPIYLGIKSATDPEVTAGLAAFIAVTFYAAELLTAPFFGALSDRFGRKPFMLLGPIFGGVAIQMLGFSAIIPVLAIVRILEGLSTASSAPATLGYLSLRTAHSEKLRSRIMGLYEAATVVGLATGAAIAGRLYDNFGTLAFTLIAFIYLLSLVLFMFVRRGAPHVPVTQPRHGFARRLLNRRVMRFAPAWLAANAVLGAWFALGPFLASGPPVADQVLMGGFRATEITTAQLLFGVLFTGGAVFWGFFMHRIGRQAMLLIGVGGLGLTSVALWMLNNGGGSIESTHPLVLAGLAIGIFVESGFTPAALAYLAEIAEEQPHDRGSVMGLYSVLLSAGQLLGAAFAAPFAERLGFNGLIILTGLLSLIALFTVLSLGYAERRAQRYAHRS